MANPIIKVSLDISDIKQKLAEIEKLTQKSQSPKGSKRQVSLPKTAQNKLLDVKEKSLTGKSAIDDEIKKQAALNALNEKALRLNRQLATGRKTDKPSTKTAEGRQLQSELDTIKAGSKAAVAKRIGRGTKGLTPTQQKLYDAEFAKTLRSVSTEGVELGKIPAAFKKKAAPVLRSTRTRDDVVIGDRPKAPPVAAPSTAGGGSGSASSKQAKDLQGLSELEILQQRKLVLERKGILASSSKIKKIDEEIAVLSQKYAADLANAVSKSPENVGIRNVRKETAQRNRAIDAGVPFEEVPKNIAGAQAKAQNIEKQLATLSGTQLAAAEKELLQQYEIIKANAEILGDKKLVAAANNQIRASRSRETAAANLAAAPAKKLQKAQEQEAIDRSPEGQAAAQQKAATALLNKQTGRLETAKLQGDLPQDATLASVKNAQVAATTEAVKISKTLNGLTGNSIVTENKLLITKLKEAKEASVILADTKSSAKLGREITAAKDRIKKELARQEKQAREDAKATKKPPLTPVQRAEKAKAFAASPEGIEAERIKQEASDIRKANRAKAKAASPDSDKPLGMFGRFTSKFGLTSQKDQSASKFFGSGALTSLKYAVPSMAIFGAASGISKSLKEAEQFKVELDKIQEQVDATNWAKYGSDSKTAFTEIRSSIIAVSKETGLQLDVVASLTQQLIGAFAGETIGNKGGLELVTGQVESAAKIAIATDLAPKEITDGLTAASLSFGRTFEEIGDVAVALERSSGVLGRETIAFIGDIAPVAKEAGFSLEEFSALAATAQQRSGKSGAALAENFGRIIPAISENKDKLLELAVASEALRTPEFINAVNNSDIQGTLTTIAKEYENLNDKSKQFVVSLLGGKREAQALIPALANNEVLENLTQAAEDSSGSLETRYRKVLTSLTVSVKALVQQMHVLAMEFLDSGLTSGLQATVAAAGVLVSVLSRVLQTVGDINKLFLGFPGMLLTFALGVKGVRSAMNALAAKGLIPKFLTSSNGVTGKGATPGIVAARNTETAAINRLTAATKALEAAQFDQGLSGKALIPFEAEKAAATEAQSLATESLIIQENQLAATRIKGATAAAPVVAAQTALTRAQNEYLAAIAAVQAAESAGVGNDPAVAAANMRLVATKKAMTAAEEEYAAALTASELIQSSRTKKEVAAAAAQAAASKTSGAGTKLLRFIGGGSAILGGGVAIAAAFGAVYYGLSKKADSLSEEAKEIVKTERDATEKILNELKDKPRELAAAKEDRIDVLKELRKEALDKENILSDLATGAKSMFGRKAPDSEAQLIQDEINKLSVSPEKELALQLLESGSLAYNISKLKPRVGKATGSFEDKISDIIKISEDNVNKGIKQFEKSGKQTKLEGVDNRKFDKEEEVYLKELAKFLGLNDPSQLTGEIVKISLEDRTRFIEQITSIAATGRYIPKEGEDEGKRASKETEKLANDAIKSYKDKLAGGASQAEINALIDKESEKIFGKVASVQSEATLEELRGLLDSGGISRNQFLKGYLVQIEYMKEIIKKGGSVVDAKFLATFREAQKTYSEEISKTVSAQVSIVKRSQSFSGGTDIQRQQQILQSVISGLGTDNISADLAGELALEYIEIQKSIMDTRIQNAYTAQEAVNIANSNIDIPVDAQLGLLKSSLQQLTGSYEAFNQAFLAISDETADMFFESILIQIEGGQLTVEQGRQQMIDKINDLAAQRARLETLSPVGTPEDPSKSITIPFKPGESEQIPTPDNLKDPNDGKTITVNGVKYRYKGGKVRKWIRIETKRVGNANKTSETAISSKEAMDLGLPDPRPTNRKNVGGKAAETVPKNPPASTVRTTEQQKALDDITLVIETLFAALGLDTFAQDAQAASDEATKKEAKKLLQSERQAQFSLFSAMQTFNGDIVAAAETNIVAAKEAIANATNTTELAAAESNLISAQKALEDANNTQRAAQFALFSAVVAKDDPIAQAKISLVLAEQQAAEARGITAQADAARNVLEVQKQLTEAMNAARISQFDLRQAELNAMGDDVGAAQVAAQSARQQLADAIAAGAGVAAINQARAATISADKAARDAVFGDKMDDYKWLLDMGKITKSQYANYLEGLKTTLIPGTKQFKDLELTIKQLKNDIGSDLQQNLPTSLALPTLYEVRRLDQVSQTRDAAGRAGIGYQDNRTQDIKIYVNNGMGESEVVQVLSEALGTGRSGSGPRRY